LLFRTAETDAVLYGLQLLFGSSGAAALAAGTYTEVVWLPQQAAGTIDTAQPLVVHAGKQVVGTKVWARSWGDAQNTAKVYFIFSIHEE
jgi:hypothetical protein